MPIVIKNFLIAEIDISKEIEKKCTEFLSGSRTTNKPVSEDMIDSKFGNIFEYRFLNFSYNA